ncbi:hypothetical protein Z043_102425 [Scleropages formosus]|uniref:Glutamate-rich protein 1-like n=1 Tax=Scleropages formosus TaxID=113540 RepID=A0A0P7XMN7_SCLFO|nr:hypothetical protein Z043_102425 [Scleropages formosus]
MTTDGERSDSLSKSEDVNAEEDPAEISGQQRRRRKRRAGRGTAEAAREEREGPVVHVTQETEEDRHTTRKNSKNKKRKLKKKRHKEKLLSMGLAPRTVAVEFTYQPAGGNGEEDKEPMEDKEVQSKEGRAAELLEFLQATLEVYNCSPPTGESQENPSNPTSDAKGLLSSLFSNEMPISVLTQLYHLRSLVLQQDASKLTAALRDFQQNSALLPAGDQHRQTHGPPVGIPPGSSMVRTPLPKHGQNPRAQRRFHNSLFHT